VTSCSCRWNGPLFCVFFPAPFAWGRKQPPSDPNRAAHVQLPQEPLIAVANNILKIKDFREEGGRPVLGLDGAPVDAASPRM